MRIFRFAQLWTVLALLLLSGCIVLGPGINDSEGVLDPKVDYSDPVLKDRKIILNSTINEGTAKQVFSKLLYLNSIDPTKPIDLYLNTPGGDADNALTIVEAIEQIEAPVNVWAFVDVRSAGILVLISATGKRIATPNSVFLIHGGEKEGRAPKNYVRIMKGNYERILRSKAKLPADWFPLKEDTIHVLTPEEALKFKLIDTISRESESPNKPDAGDGK